MNLSAGKDEKDPEYQPDDPVDFIPSDLLEESTNVSEGVFGSVYECIFKPTNERRTLFMLPSKPEEWFTTVLASAFRLKHENIIRIYGRTCVDGVNGILTEWVEGTSLKKIIYDKSISYSLADLLLWNTQSFSALEYVIQSFGGEENEHFRRYFIRIACAENMILNSTRGALKICALGLFKDNPDTPDFDSEDQEFYDDSLIFPYNTRELIKLRENYIYYRTPEVRYGEYRNDEYDVFPFGLVLWECITRIEPEVWVKNNSAYFVSDYFPIIDGSPMFKQFIDQCTSEDWVPVSDIKSILENMVPAENGQNLEVFKKYTVCFWNKEEFYYCNKLTPFMDPPGVLTEKQQRRVTRIYDYKLLKNLKVLASGSFGKVCSAEYEDKKVAVKFLKAMKMYPFLQEFIILKELKHKNLIKAVGQIQKHGVYGIVMKYIDGTSLDKIIHEYPSKYTLGDVLTWNYQAASALEYMHSKRLLHRDIKPDNMLIEHSEKRTLKLVDLGGAKKIQNSLNFTGIGTELYIAPEIDKKDSYDEKCDVYSWTVTFWECCTAERPRCPPDYRSKVKQICSAKFLEIIEQCSSEEPSQRKCMFIMRKWLRDMLNNRKAFTETDSTFRENHICVWNKQTNELYYFSKTESDKQFEEILIKSKTLLADVPMNAIKIIRDLAYETGNVKLIEIDNMQFKPRNDSECRCEKIDTLENLHSVADETVDEPEKRSRKCFQCKQIFQLNAGKKVLKFSKYADEKYLKNEFVILSKLKHENIVKLLGYTHDNELNYFGIITEHFDGETLDKAIIIKFYQTKRIVQYGLQFARALEYMHSQNILHCDFEPKNIIVKEDQSKICDFKLSCHFRYEHPKEAVGTRVYMAPEVMPNGAFTKKSDVYSWTVTFWEMCWRQKYVPFPEAVNDCINQHPDLSDIKDIKNVENNNVNKDHKCYDYIEHTKPIDLCKAGKRYRIENGSDKFNEFIQACANEDPEKRWSMTDIATLLENMMNSSYVPDFDNTLADAIVKDNICLWRNDIHRQREEWNFFYASVKH